jgi:hypothetical protein
MHWVDIIHWISTILAAIAAGAGGGAAREKINRRRNRP